MPILTRENLAQRFRQNWLATHPQDVPPTMRIDDSLTSLSWLQNLSMSKMPGTASAEMPQLTPRPSNPNDIRVNPNAVLDMLPFSRQNSNRSDSGDISIGVHPPVTNQVHDDIDYKNNPYVKPPYSYATLICMAMNESKKNKITLAGIYSWITDHYMYYKVADPSWQNSIRHNLSLNKCFQKVPRRKDEPGKGGFWRINPEYSDMFENGVFKRRRSTTTREIVTMPPAKRIKRDLEDMLGVSSRDEQSVVIRNQSGVDETVTIGTDFNWNNILQQDIVVGGKRIKTEQLIDDQEVLAATNSIMGDAASPIMDLSPPPSESNSDIGLDEFLNYDLQVGSDLDSALDLTSGDPLDLSITGTSIRPPEWWSDALNGESNEASLGFHNSFAPSPIDELSHPWAESPVKVEEAMANFDIDLERLFTDESLTYPDC